MPYALLTQKMEKVRGRSESSSTNRGRNVAAFFAGDKPKARENVRTHLSGTLAKDLKEHGFIAVDGEIDKAIAKLKTGAKGIHPFHWEMEFPEVFSVDERGEQTGGFDVIVGNPPFAGGRKVKEAFGQNYLAWMQALHSESHGNADLVAQFVRRAFDLLKQGGCLGLIATNTIGQGDTRHTGLRWICLHGGSIYRAQKRLKWPGQAAVVVSVVHIIKGLTSFPLFLDGRQVPIITAYLFHAGGNESPNRLAANEKKCFIGNVVLGMGFTFDDSGEPGVTNPISEMERLVEKDPTNGDRILPYLGGEELNSDPRHSHRRFIISFDDWPLRRANLSYSWVGASTEVRRECLRTGIVPLDYSDHVAADYPDLLAIVEEKVKPERMKDQQREYREYWWKYARRAVDLNRYIRHYRPSQILAVNCGATPHLAISFLSARQVFSHSLALFTTSSTAAFSALQSRPHEVWARFMASSMKDDLRYTPSDCFETFPFPAGYESRPDLEHAGKAYYEFRAELMVRNNEGLTKTYNRFHDPNEDSPDIQRLRDLHAAMDRAVLDAYGWQDIQPRLRFLPRV